MTFAELRADVYRRLQYATVPKPDVATRIGAFLDETHHDLLTDPAATWLRDDVTSFASVANQSRYALPPNLARVNAIYETTNQRKLDEMSLSALRLIDPSPHSGSPDYYVPLSFSEVVQQPSAAAELFVKSTSAADTTQLARVEGVTTGGYTTAAEVTLTGATAVSLNTAITTWVEVTRFYLSASCAGVVTLTQTSGAGTTLSTIGIGQLHSQNFTILLWPTPSSAITYLVDYTRDVPTRFNPNDSPLLPKDFHRLVAIGARMKEYEFQDDSRYQVAQKEYMDGLSQMRRWMHERNSRRVVPGVLGVRGRSSLGGWYPSDTGI